MDEQDKSEEFYLEGFVNFLYRLTDELKLPVLKTFGLDKNQLSLICENTDIKNNPVSLSGIDLMEILLKRF